MNFLGMNRNVLKKTKSPKLSADKVLQNIYHERIICTHVSMKVEMFLRNALLGGVWKNVLVASSPHHMRETTSL